MEIIKNNKTKRLIFSLIWCFFLIRITKLISFDFQNLITTMLDITSLCIFFGLAIYIILNFFLKKKISKITFLVIYPTIGVIAYYINGFRNDYQEGILIHHFITLSSIIFYFSLIHSDKNFDYKFKENLLKISLAFVIIFCFFNVIPAIIAKIYSYDSLRHTTETIIKFFGNEIIFRQNINGQSKFLLIIFIVCIFLFKKFLFNKKNISHLFFIFALLLITIIFLAQSRLNILSSIVFSFFFLLMIKNLSLGKKLIYFLLILVIPIGTFNFYTDHQTRFSEKTIIQEKVGIKKFTTNHGKYNKDLLRFLKIDTTDLIVNKKIPDFTLNNAIKEKIISIFFNNKKLIDEKVINNNASSLHEEYLINYHILDTITRNFSKIESIDSFSNSEIDQIKILLKRKINVSKLFLLNSCSENFRFFDNLLTGRVCGWQFLWNSITVKELILGKGFFGDQVFLKPIEKISSNSFINIFYNAGIISLIICIIILIIFFTKFFKIRNLNDNNLYFALSHYLILYFLFRSIFEDTLAFVSIDFLIFSLCFSLICQKYKEKNN